MDDPKCIRCDVVMTQGWIPDPRWMYTYPQYWLEGSPPKGGVLVGSPSSEGTERFVVGAYRCPTCGRVDLYTVRQLK